MSTKPRGQSAGKSLAELTRFKLLWRDTLDEEQKDFWRSRFGSESTQAALRAELRMELGVNLSQDNQLTLFRQWDEANCERELMAAKSEARKKDLLAGGMTLAEAQEVLLTEAAAYSTTRRDFKLGLKTSAEISKTISSRLDEEKFKEGLRTKLESALAALADHIKGNPEAKAAYEKFKATITASTK